MILIEVDWPVSFALSAKNRAEAKEQSSFGSALSSALVSALGVALQRCSYPPHKCLILSRLFILPWQRGHFYFVKKGTFLFWVDSAIGWLSSDI